MKRLHIPLVLAAASFLLAVDAGADDAKTKRKIEERLAKAGLDSSADIQVTVAQGVARLDGAVVDYEASFRAGKAALKEAKTVENRLVVGAEPRPDADIRKDVEEAILRYPYYGVFDSVEIGVKDGVVALSGSVYQPWRKSDLEARIAEVDGIRALESELRVQSVSGFDESLRRQLVRRIYGSENFVQYANWPHPPIRIVVENGKITLTGYVRSNVEQVMLGHIARGTLAFGVDNRVEVEGTRPEEGAKTPTKS
ncbi:MAG TPA: BON domain-containing protein [Vicinamibacteria bacterium]